MTNNEAPDQKRTPKHTEGKLNFNELVRDIAAFFFEVAIPYFIAFSIWYVLARRFKFWQLNDFVGIAIFVIFVPGLALLSNVFIRNLVEWGKQIVGEDVRPRREARAWRIIRIVITGLLIPIALSVAANMIPVTKEDTVLSLAIKTMLYGEEYSFITTIGDMVISASSNETKIAGIRALAAIHSRSTLDQLLRIFQEDHASLSNSGFYKALSAGIASYGVDARPGLLQIFFSSSEFRSTAPRGLKPGLFDRFFKQSFEELRDEINRNVSETDERVAELLELDGMQYQLRQFLADVEMQAPIILQGDPSLDFVVDTFNLMTDLKTDQEIYYLARNVAVDPTYAEGTRLRAVALMAKLGSKDDFPLLISFLKTEDEEFQRAALEAITVIHRKSLAQEKQTDDNSPVSQ